MNSALKKKKGALIYAASACAGGAAATLLWFSRGAGTKFQAGQCQRRLGQKKATSNARTTSAKQAELVGLVPETW